MRLGLKFKIIIFVVLLINLAVIVVGLIARNELAVSISTNTEQIMTLNAQKSVQVLKDVNKKEFYLLESVASLPFIRDESISLEQKTEQLEGIVRENPSHFENLAFYSEQGICIRPDGEYVDVSEICIMFGGGGHVRAAGCESAMTLEQIRQALTEEIYKQLNK